MRHRVSQPDSIPADGGRVVTVVPDYKPRVVDRELAVELEAVGAILIDGARGCGKPAIAAVSQHTEAGVSISAEQPDGEI